MKKYPAIRVEESNVYEGSVTKFSTYMLSVDYSELVKLARVKSISTNREVDHSRAEKMIDFISKSGSFYPPIIVATDSIGSFRYDNDTNTCEFNISSEKGNELIIIDGQHRFTSIQKLLALEIGDKFKEIKQAVFLIDGINELKRREVFLEINDNAKRVSTGDKERYKTNVSNYLSLKLINKIEVIKYINWGANQTTKINEYPYKFIVKSNKLLLNQAEKDFKSAKIDLKAIDKLLKSLEYIWEINFMYFEENSQYNVVNTEVFIKAVFKHFSEKYILYYDKAIKSNDFDITEFKVSYSNAIDKVFENIIRIDDVSKRSKSIAEKSRAINELLTELEENDA